MNLDFSDKIGSLLDKMGSKGAYTLFVGMLLLVFCLDYFLLMNPQMAALRKINPEIKVVSDEIKKAKEDMQKLDTYKQDLENLSKKFDEANLRVRARDEVPIILEHIAYVASETGIQIDQIMPDALGQELLTENNQRKYFDLPIYLEARSGYHNLGRFLNKIDTEDISLRIGAFTVSATDDKQYHSIKLTLKATVFEDMRP